MNGGNMYILQFYFICSKQTKLACKKFKMTQYGKNSREWTEKKPKKEVKLNAWKFNIH